MRRDPHSYADDSQPQTRSLSFRARLDFAAKQLDAEAALTFTAPAAAGPFDLDTRDLAIASVEDLAGAPLAHRLHPPDPVLGARLEVMVPKGCEGVRIRYRTAPTASALQWLDGDFLFTQCQAIHARSVVPLQDTPRLRITYDAQLTLPARLTSVMAAAFEKRTVAGDEATDHFTMPQAIPPYLFAFAAGQLVSRELGPRSRVWAQPSQIDAAAAEFSGVNAMMAAAEKLFGPYDWDRFDLLTMPPSFPYGGMENPRLTFLTPTIITGDKSLVNVVAHELAHSWTGNLVSNADAEHFWLNEGFTVYAERRILEALEGKDTADLHRALGRRSLDDAVARFHDRPALTHLRTHLVGIDPDDAYSQVPYEKGCLFLETIEAAVGRDAFAQFLKAYLAAFRFRSITTDDFVLLCERELPGALTRVNAVAWLDGPGVPANAVSVRSTRLDAVVAVGSSVPSAAEAGGWDVAQWQLYLDAVPRPAAAGVCASLDQRFHLTANKNPEVLVAWLVLAVRSGHAPALPRLEALLGEVGRMKYLKPLYQALARTDPARAKACFARVRSGYHPIAQQVIEGLLARTPAVH